MGREIQEVGTYEPAYPPSGVQEDVSAKIFSITKEAGRPRPR